MLPGSMMLGNFSDDRRSSWWSLVGDYVEHRLEDAYVNPGSGAGTDQIEDRCRSRRDTTLDGVPAGSSTLEGIRGKRAVTTSNRCRGLRA